MKKKEIDYSKVQRYDMVDKHWYGDQWEEIGECNHGDYVLYSDYEKLLADKTPPRLPATFKDVVALIKGKADSLEKYAFSHFEEKDKINYGYAIEQYQKAESLRQAIYLLKNESFTE